MIRQRLPEIARFAAVGLINTGIDFALFYVAFYWLGAHLIVANTLAYGIATINSYVLNKYWTFASRSAADITSAEFSKFVFFNLGGLALSNAAVFALAAYVPPMLAKIGAIGATFIWNYLTIRRFVFRQ